MNTKDTEQLRERVQNIIYEDISGKFEVRWYPILDDDHDSWVRPGIDTKTHREAFAYVADQIMALVEAHTREARIDELQCLNKDIIGDLLTANDIKSAISAHISYLRHQQEGSK